jgi:adenylylsulfate kinase
VTSSNIAWHHATVTRSRREAQNGHRSVAVWFTGLSGSGKSTLAHAVEEQLQDRKSTRLNSSHNSESRMPSSA